MEQMNITIAGVEYKVKQSFRALLEFEKLTGQSVYTINESLDSIVKLFYCVLKANNRDIFKFTLDEFIDLIDENPDSLEFYNNYLVSQVETEGNTEKKAKKKTK